MYPYFKRGFDFILALFSLIIIAPIFLLLCLIIKLDSEGPIFFKQKRMGIKGTEFYMLKFRTMRVDTPKDVPTRFLKNPDKYITRVGKILRRTSLDEVPQLVNIIRGQMSLVGPRPVVLTEADLIVERDKYGANDVLPGLTGWAQINGRDILRPSTKAKLDGEYVKRMSFLFDLQCIMKTVIVVFKGEGVVEGELDSEIDAASLERKM